MHVQRRFLSALILFDNNALLRQNFYTRLIIGTCFVRRLNVVILTSVQIMTLVFTIKYQNKYTSGACTWNLNRWHGKGWKAVNRAWDILKVQSARICCLLTELSIMFAKCEVTPERQHGLNLIIPQSACPPRLRVHGLQRSVLFSSVKKFRSIIIFSVNFTPPNSDKDLLRG